MNDISNELRSLSEHVASISRETPYRVADDYFADFAARVLIRIKTQHKPVTFNVPEGYFEGFAQSVLARIKAGAGKDSGSTTIPGREDSPAVSVEEELATLSPLLAGVRGIQPYRIPDGYFQELSPILTVARDLNPYTVPEEYFHQLPAEIEAKLPEPQVKKKQGKVIALGGRRANWLKYSVAAVVAGLILTVGWLRLHVSGGTDKGAPADVVAGMLPKASDEELQRYLDDQDTTLAQPVNNLATAMDFSEGDLKNLLGDVSDGELKQYMEEHGGANDLATN
ncbi:hypothetical protein [Puia dinghuensis]|nr:hypothetical protein [Puia dinghuensis]